MNDILITYIFWKSLVLLVYIYAGYPILLWILSKFTSIKHQPDESYKPMVSILIAAHNERLSLPAKLESIRKQNYPQEKIQILIASDASTDGTDEYLQQQDDVELVVFTDQSGKNNALNVLLPKADGEILVYTDANIIFHEDVLKHTAKHYVNPNVGVVAAELEYLDDSSQTCVGKSTGLYWKYENAIKRMESHLGSVLVVSGALFSARNGLVNQLDPRIANDLEVPMRVAAQGYCVLAEPDCICYEKPHQTISEEWNRTTRIVARGMNGFIQLFPLISKSPMRLWQFISHKFLRWFTLMLGLFVLISSISAKPTYIAIPVFVIGLSALLNGLMGFLFVGKKNNPKILKPITLLTHLLIMFSAGTVGMMYGIAGKSPAVWKSPQASRQAAP